MSKIDVIRAWKDPEYRSNLSEAELGALPDNPAGPMELTDDELDSAAGGDTAGYLCTLRYNCNSECKCPDTLSTWNISCCDR